MNFSADSTAVYSLFGNHDIMNSEMILEKYQYGLSGGKAWLMYHSNARHPRQNASADNSSLKNKARDPSVKVSKCYVATALYGSYDAPEVLILRRFRNEVLSKSLPGRAFICTYYAVSPPFARRLENAGRVNRIVRRILDKIVRRLDSAEE